MFRILVVDDNPEFRRGLAKALRLHGYEATEAGDGREAMALLRENPQDLVITDINMPEMDGIEVLIELRATDARVPVIAISGGGLVPKSFLLGNASVLGAVETLEKPFELAALLAAVERLLAGGGG